MRRSFAPWDDPDAKPLIRFERDQAFGDFTAVDNLSLDIYEREFFALLGPSGCGKTTIDAHARRVREPTEGELDLDGSRLRRPAQQAAGEHDVPVLCAVSAHERGRQHRLRPEADGMPKGEREERVARCSSW
jgi:putrescine transport system ATP-binding protein